MQTLISILIAAVAVLFAGGSFYVASKERKERKQAEKELREISVPSTAGTLSFLKLSELSKSEAPSLHLHTI